MITKARILVCHELFQIFSRLLESLRTTDYSGFLIFPNPNIYANGGNSSSTDFSKV